MVRQEQPHLTSEVGVRPCAYPEYSTQTKRLNFAVDEELI